jgi:ADP-ribosylglycohydrolase
MHNSAFEQVLRGVIAVGGETDTIASITGLVLGTRLGASALPDHLVRRIPSTEPVVAMAERFAASIGCQGSRRVQISQNQRSDGQA